MTAHVTRLGRLVLLTSCASVWACSADNGTGSLQGTLDVPACEYRHEGDAWIPRSFAEVTPKDRDGQPYLTMKTNWNFFVGQPLDAPGPKFPADHPQNQIKIRMQNRSGGWDAADTLFFWVLDSYEVGRCMRGLSKPNGDPDWDQVACDRSTNEGRMRIGTQGELVTSHFALQDSCPSARLMGQALGSCTQAGCPDVAICPGRGSWIAFSRFGDFPSDETKALSPDFKVNIGNQIVASAFHVELCDQSTVTAVQMNTVPVPPPAIRGTLDGAFSFELEPS